MVKVGECGRALVLVAEEVDVDPGCGCAAGRGCWSCPGGREHCRSGAVSGAGHFPRQCDLRSVDGEDAASLPRGIVGTVGEDSPVQGLEGGFVKLFAPFWPGTPPAVRPGAGRCRPAGIVVTVRGASHGSRVARRDDQTEDEQNAQKGGEHAAALLPTRILALRHGGGGGDRRLPPPGETAVAAARAPAFGPARRFRGGPRLILGVRCAGSPAVRARRQNIETLDGLALAAGRADALPAGRTVARGPGAVFRLLLPTHP